MEPRFAHDFSGVRVHTDMHAAVSAAAVGARAYTVGHDVVFGAGQFTPGSESGRHLLAHELAHTLQQGRAAKRLQRSCVASPCPPLNVSVSALFPRYEAAEKCIQQLYAETHPAKRGISLSFNADWQHLTGGTPLERLALGCLRAEDKPGAGPNFTARGGLKGGEPDIWDFQNQTMYEITTRSGAAFRVRKLGTEIALANSLCGPADCGGLQFSPGPWVPPGGCYALGGDLYFTTVNTQGVIVYDLIKDVSKELATATALALAAALLKKLGPKAAGALAGRLAPVYAAASALAAAVLLASGRAEAKLGPGDKEPITQLFESLGKDGIKVPPEIQQMLNDFPELKDKLNKAMGKGGNLTAAQEEFAKKMLDTIAANKDKFTAEDLEALLAATSAASKAVPAGDVTVEKLKKLAKEAGSAAGGGQGGGHSADPGLSQDKKVPPKETGGAAPKGHDDKAQPTEISPETRKHLANAPAPVRQLLTDLLSSTPAANKMSDADLKRFLDMVPPQLSAEKAAKLRGRMKIVKNETVKEILDSLQAALAEPDDTASTAPKTATAPDNTPAPTPQATRPDAGDTATRTTEPTDRTKFADAQKLIKELAETAKHTSFTGLAPGNFRISWRGGTDQGSTITGNIRGIEPTSKIPYVGRIEAEVTGVDKSNSLKRKIKFIGATPMVSAAGQIVLPASHFLDNQEREVTLDSMPSGKGRK
jgi:hypothetical protein